MSGTSNEFDDARSTGAGDPAEQPSTAEVVPGAGAHPADSYGEAHTDDEPAPAPVPGTQNAPAQDMHDTTAEDQIAGIVAQTRADVGDADESRIADVLRQRFEQTGIRVADDRVAALAAEVSQR